MPRLYADPTLVSNGYIPFNPKDIVSAAASRKPGYVDYVTSVAVKPADGYWYIPKSELKYISTEYAIKREASIYEAIFDSTIPCNFKGCEALRKAYTEEMKDTDPNCSGCMKQRIKNKYVTLSKEISI